MMQSNVSYIVPNKEVLDSVIRGQAERNVLEVSRNGYLSKMKVITELLEKVPELKAQALELDANGNARKYKGEASNILRLKLPMSPETAQALFALISIDTTLPKKRKRVRQKNDGDHINDNAPSGDASVTAATGEQEGEVQEEQESVASTPTNEGDHAAAAVVGREMREYIRNPAKDYVTVSSQTYQNYKSALKWWHEYDCLDMEKVGSVFPAEVDKVCKTSIASYKRDVGSKKRRGIMRQKEGMSQFSAYGYGYLSQYFMKMKPDRKKKTWNEGIFASNFLKMSVNTIGRSDNVDDLLLKLIDWENDALTIKFGTTKPDQSGATTSFVKRIYANPYSPEYCLILDLAVYTWCKRRTSEEDCIHLYDGETQNQRYYNILVSALEEIPANVDLGCDRSMIGTHSCRKFAESYAASKVDGPTKTHVALRAGQSTGRTTDCYLISEEDGDAITGRTVAMLKLTADEFDVLAPHFQPDTLDELHKYGWDNILHGFKHYPESYQRAIKVLFANLVYHWHKGNIHELYSPGHPIFSQTIFTDLTLVNSLRDKAVLIHNYDPFTQWTATGVPAFIVISREIRELRAEFNSTKDNYNERIDAIQEVLSSSMSEIPAMVVDRLLQRFTVQGVAPVCIDDIRRCINEMLSSDGSGALQEIRNSIGAITARLNSGFSVTNNGTMAVHPQGSGSTAALPIIHTVGQYFYWPGIDGRLHTVPPGFIFPSHPAATMWNVWHFGDASRSICPFKHIDAARDLTSDVCKQNYYRTSKVMAALINIATDGEKKIINSAKELTPINAKDAFDYAYPILVSRLYPNKNPSRKNDSNINTLGNRMLKFK
jgi:hypothetical protein